MGRERGGGSRGEECKPEQILIGRMFPHRLLARVYFASEGERPAFIFSFLFFSNTTKITRGKLPVRTRIVSPREANGH